MDPYYEGTLTTFAWWEFDPLGFQLAYPLETHQQMFFKGAADAPYWQGAILTLAAAADFTRSLSQQRNMTTAGDTGSNYPPNNGAVPGTERTVTLEAGQTLGRYGEIRADSNFVTTSGASPNSLALPSNTNPTVYTEIQVLKPIPGVTQATVTEWPIGSGTGGGLQYQLPMSLETLKALGYISY